MHHPFLVSWHGTRINPDISQGSALVRATSDKLSPMQHHIDLAHGRCSCILLSVSSSRDEDLPLYDVESPGDLGSSIRTSQIGNLAP